MKRNIQIRVEVAIAALLAIGGAVYAGQPYVMTQNGLVQPPAPRKVVIDERQVKQACVKGLQALERADSRIAPEKVSMRSIAGGLFLCDIQAQQVEGPGLVMVNGKITTTPVRYSVTFDPSTGRTSAFRVDDTEAMRAARAVLAEALITTKVESSTQGRVDINADVNGLGCRIAMESVAIPGTTDQRWLAKSWNCGKWRHGP